MSSAQSAASPQRGAERPAAQGIGRYQVGTQLASGGMGTIFSAHDTLAKRDVAYKRLKVTNESARARLSALFEREYNALRQLKHPNIVEVYDYGLDVEGPFYTMELLGGRDLANAGQLTLSETCRIVRDVASALALLHTRRIVHRDVTPANVRLTRGGRAKLLDFGALSEFGVAKEIVGTPSFIAPESLASGVLDARTDLFALGALAYWALTQHHAYPARTVADLQAAWEVPVVPPSRHVPELPREIDELLLALLEREQVARPASAAHVIERLSAIAGLNPEQDEQDAAQSFLMRPPLAGRASVIDQLKCFAAEASAGNGRSVVIEAPSGLGRSALLDQAAVSAQLGGANVLRFQPNGKRGAGLSRAVFEWMRTSFPELLRVELGKSLAALHEAEAPLRPARSPAELAQQRAHLIGAVQSAVDAMSALAPLTLLVDDVQRADAESLAILVSLARRSAEQRVLIVISKELGSSGSDANALSELCADATQLSLRALEETDVQALVQAVFGEVPNSRRLARFLHAQSGGNPAQCVDLCRLLLQRGEIRYTLGSFALPFDPRADLHGARALELTRLTGLDEQALRLVQLLSLHDSGLSADQACQALSMAPEHLLLSGLDLSARGLVFAHSGSLSLASESLRAAVRDALTPEQRSELHLAISQCILCENPSAIESKLAACHHLLCAGKEDEAIELVWEPLQQSAMPLESTGTCAPVLERLLATLNARGYRDEHCWSLLHPLVNAGFWGELGISNRYRDRAISALANLTGLGLARRLIPYLGRKAALWLGLAFGMLRFAFMPKRVRPRSYAEAIQRFFSSVTMSTATAAAALEPETAQRMVAFLDPLAAMKEQSPGRVAREFAQATAEVAAGLNARAAERYTRIMRLLDQHAVFDKVSQAGFYDGCAHGRAQAEVMAGAPSALASAELLAQRHPFFRPHVETIRMTYHGLRGEQALADAHRREGEMLALQGGLSWSAFSVMAIRSAYIAMLAQDTLGVLQAAVELERLSAIAPKALIYRDLCRAYAALMRGEPDLAIEIYERCDALPDARLRRVWEVDRAFYAEALVRVARVREAKAVCEEVIAVRGAQGASPFTLRAARQQLALIEVKLGNVALGKQLLSELLAQLGANSSPLAIGSICRDQARIALMELDQDGFEEHFTGMVEAFRTTDNPILIQQCRRLLAEAQKRGVAAAPSWEQHQLAKPANSQDLTSQAPEVTELVETCS